MTATLISPSGAVLHHRARCSTTPAEEAEAKSVRVWFKKECRLEENRVFLKHRNVRAFLRAVSATVDGGGGAYRIDDATSRAKRGVMGLAADSPEARDLVAVEVLRELAAIERIQAGDVWTALLVLAPCWPGLPAAPGANGHFVPPALEYERFCERYRSFAGTVDAMAGALAFGRATANPNGRPAPANDAG